MTMQASIYGRAIRIKRVETRTGTPMVVCTVAVNLPVDRSEDQATEWFSVVTFNDAAEHLAGLEDGSYISAIGQVRVRLWKDKDGKDRRELSMVANNLLTARSSRPAGGRKPQAEKPEEDPFGDSIPF